MKTLNLLFALLSLACFIPIAWCEVSSVWFAGDRMIGFVFVATLPAILVVAIFWLVFAALKKSWVIALSTVVGSAIAISPLFFGPELIFKSWNHSIAKFDRVNSEALATADLSNFDYSPHHGFYRMELKPLPRFEWYCDQHIAAPEGVFSAFSINKVPHVYVNKIRHGAKGLAYAPDESMLPANGEFEYQYSGVDSWYIWSF